MLWPARRTSRRQRSAGHLVLAHLNRIGWNVCTTSICPSGIPAEHSTSKENASSWARMVKTAWQKVGAELQNNTQGRITEAQIDPFDISIEESMAEDLSRHFQNTLDTLKEFRNYFLKQLPIVFNGPFPDRLRSVPHDFDPKNHIFLDAPDDGKTMVVFHGTKISICFDYGKNTRLDYTFLCGRNPIEDYEELIWLIRIMRR